MKPIVTTRQGKLQGSVADGIHVFKGVAYAAPPFGTDRFLPPQPVAPWGGVREAVDQGHQPPQVPYLPPYDAMLPELVASGEDCLNLTIWSPGKGTTGNPVMVWIPGGAFEHGSNAAYDGSRFARDGVVCVAINYRVGADGFLYLGDGHANCGLLDQVAALEWVRDNITAFGGDPGNVTVFGESAGAISIADERGLRLATIPRREQDCHAVRYTLRGRERPLGGDPQRLGQPFGLFGCALVGTVGVVNVQAAQLTPERPNVNLGAAQSRARSMPAAFAFCVLTFAWTWGVWAVISFLGDLPPGMSTALFLASAFGPSLAAIAVTLIFGGGRYLRHWLRQCLKWRIGWRWYAIALLAPPIVMLAALGLHAAVGGVIPLSPVAGHVLVAVAQFPLIVLFGGPLGEEFGWRGYALPALSTRIGWRTASLVIGAIWGLWHVPLFYIANTAQADLPMALFLASTVALSVMFARLSVNTGLSVVPAILLHSAINWWSMVLPVMPKGGDTQVYSLVMALVIAIGLAALLMPDSGKRQPC